MQLALFCSSQHCHALKQRIVPQWIKIGFVVDELAEVAVDVEGIGEIAQGHPPVVGQAPVTG